MIEAHGGFRVTLPLDASIRLQKEVRSAYVLLTWCIGRITIEWLSPRRDVRVGAVFGGTPHTDADIAADITRLGYKCCADQVYRWRRALAEKGIIAWERTPSGARLLVIDSQKIKDCWVESEMPAWAWNAANTALRRYKPPPDSSGALRLFSAEVSA